MKTIKKIRRSKRGFSLMEVLVVTTIFSIFSIFLVNLVMASQQTMAVQQSAVPVRMEAKKVIERIVKELRAADASAPNGIATEGSGDSMGITFYIPNQVSAAGTITSYRKIKYEHSDTDKTVLRTENDTTITTEGRNIDALRFLFAGHYTYQVQLDASKIVTGGTDTITVSLTSEARARN